MKFLGMFLFVFSYICADDHKEIFVLKTGWHSGIIMKIKEIDSSILNIHPYFEKFDFIEIGWGDEDYYRSLQHPLWMTLKAGLLPTSSVLHVRALNSNDLHSSPKENIVKLTVSNEEFTNLLKFIANSFAKKDDKLVVISKGHYPNSLFFLSSYTYHIFRTCNVWTAQALREAKLDVTPFFAISVDSLFSQLNQIKDLTPENQSHEPQQPHDL